MRKFLIGLVAGVVIAIPVSVSGVFAVPTPESPVGFEITEDLRVVRVFDADANEWITEIWPSRCTVFEDGSARCPSYAEN